MDKTKECVGSRVINAIVAFSAPKVTFSDHSLGLEASLSNLERALSTTQFPIVTTTVGWLIKSIARSYVGWDF